MIRTHYSAIALLAVNIALLGCGQVQSDASSDVGSAATSGAGAGSAGAGNASAGSAGALDGAAGRSLGPMLELDHSDCALRPSSDCAGVVTRYESNGGFDDTPAFAHCSAFNSFDGCGEFTFLFDDSGCVTSVALGPQVVMDGDHLVELRGCLTDALRAARWPCLTSGRLRYEESCLIR